MKKFLLLSLLFLLPALGHSRIRIDGTTCLSVSNDRIYHDTNCNGVKDAGEEYVDAMIAGSTNYIWNSNDLQSGSTFYVSSGTAQDMNVDTLQFNILFTDGAQEGRMQWNAADGTPEIGMPGGNVNLQVGQEMLARAINAAGGTLPNGVPVYISGATGGNIQISTADADIALNIGFRTIGLATEEIENNQLGYLTTGGVVRDLNTLAFPAGSPAYLAVGGGITNIPPEAPNIKIILGVVRRQHATEGEIFAHLTSIPNLASLSDVETTTMIGNQFMQWDGTDERFENRSNIIVPGNVTIGTGTAGVDYTLTFDGETFDGIATWMEDEARLDLGGHLRVEGDSDVIGDITIDINNLAIPPGGTGLTFSESGTLRAALVKSGTDFKFRFSTGAASPVDRIVMTNQSADITFNPISSGFTLSESSISFDSGSSDPIMDWTEDGKIILTLSSFTVNSNSGQDAVVLSNDVIDDREIDFGTGTFQVGAVDIPIEDDESVWDATNVEDALTETGEHLKFFTGTFEETFSATVTVSGSDAIMSIEQAGGGDLTMFFSDSHTTLDTTPPLTIILTEGSDDSPTENFIYIPQSSKVLTKSVSDWATEEHIKIGYFLVPSTTFVTNNGAYITQNWNDHAAGVNGQGHMTHITERSRYLKAVYHDGIDGNGDGGTYIERTAASPDTVFIKTTAGTVMQLHRHASPAFDTSGSDIFMIPNSSVVAYETGQDLYDFLVDASGGALTNRYYNLVLWGAANKTGTFEPLLINLPTGSYLQQASAEQDASGYDVFSMPTPFTNESTTGFLIARLTMKHASAGGGDLELISTVDLRGTTPQSVSGGNAAGALVNFADNQFTIFDESDVTKIIAFDASGITAANTRTFTAPDESGTMALLESTQTFSGSAAFTSSMTLSGNRTVYNTSPSDTNVLSWSDANSWWYPAAAGTGDVVLAATQTFSGSNTFLATVIVSTDMGIGTATPEKRLTVVDEIQIETAGASDPTLYFKTTNTANEVNIALDESATDDIINFDGKTASVNTEIRVRAQDGEDAIWRLFSGTGNSSSVAHTSNDDLVLRSRTQDKDIFFQVNDGGANITPMIIKGASGNIGIGTVAPDGKFHVNTEAAEAMIVYVDGEANQDKSIQIRDFDDSEASGVGKNLWVLKSAAASRFDIGHFNNAEAESQIMTFLAGGDVGIGVTDPDELLEVDGNIRTTTDADKYYAGTAKDSYWEFDGNSLNIVANSVTAADDLEFTGDTYVFNGDSNEILLGAAKDALIEFDGNSLNITANSVTATDDIILTAESVQQPTQPSFLVTNGAGAADVTGDGTTYTVLWPTEVRDRGSDFASNAFTASVTGDHLLIANIYFNGLLSSHTQARIDIVTSNRTYFSLTQAWHQTVNKGLNISAIADMDAGDTAIVQVTVWNGTKVVDISGDARANNFSGTLLN